MSERSCDLCSRTIRAYGGSTHTRCVTCRRTPGVDLSPRPCGRCREPFSPANPDKVKASNRRSSVAQAERDAADPERARARRQRSWQRYRAAVRSGRLPERFRDPEKQQRDWALRRARKYGVEYEDFANREIFDRDDWTCQLCERVIDPALRWPNPGSVSLDHVVALSRGGGHTRRNTQAAHIGCNWHKYVNAS